MADNDTASHAPSSADKASSPDSDAHSLQRAPEKRSFLSGLFSFMRTRNTNNSLRENLTDALSEKDSEDALFSAQERTMLSNILALHDMRVDDIMIPRSEIEALELDTPLGEALGLFERSGHSRMPVYVETLDDPRGMLHIRDVLNYITRTARENQDNGDAKDAHYPKLSQIDLSVPISDLNLVRNVLFVPSSMPISQLMARMQATHIQMALVIDEHGGTDGLASLEDVVETVFGDIEDEHDANTIMMVAQPDGSWIIDARAELEDVVESVGPELVLDEKISDVDTIGGLIVALAEHIPVKGEQIEIAPGFICNILEADSRRIQKVRLARDSGQASEING